MFDIGATELLVIVIVAILVIGPKDMPMALRTAGRWIAKLRRMSGHFRAGVDAMIREAELEEMEREWRDRNANIMKTHPHETEPARLAEPLDGTSANAAPSSASAEARVPASGERSEPIRLKTDADHSPDASTSGPASDSSAP